MGVIDLYSRRRRLAENAATDVYQYTLIPGPLRIQVVHIWTTAVGAGEFHDSLWAHVHDSIARERGVHELGHGPGTSAFVRCKQFVQEAETDYFLDIVELTFQLIDGIVRGRFHEMKRDRGLSQEADDAIDELNTRFRDHGVGYQFESGRIIRVDSQFVHAEVVKPALAMLGAPKYSIAKEEFLSGHEHYRHGRMREAIADALKCFESVMKVIADGREWTYPEKATARKLIDVLLEHELVPAYIQSQFTALVSVLESGLPTVRNKIAHGQGTTPLDVPDYLAAFALHQAAANVLFLAEADRRTQ